MSFAAERLELNLARLRLGLPVALLVHLAHVVAFVASRSAADTTAQAGWKTGLIAAHAALAISSVVAWFATRSRVRAAVPHAAEATWLVGGALVAGIDQAITTDTSPWLVVVLLVVLLLRLDERWHAAWLSVGLGAMLVGQWVFQVDAQVRLSNSVKGLSVAVMGAVLGAVLSRAERRAAEQRDTIARQQAELERALAEARAANEAKSVFLATISHELRTPLSGVLGLTELLLLTHLEPRQREFLETVQSSGASLVTLINDLLDLSKAEAGRLEVERVPVDVEREVAEVARLFTGRAQGKQLALETKWLGDPPPVLLGDGLRLRQVLSNLVSNALKFTARGGVTLACRATRDGARWALRLDVVDTGPGIDAATRARLFKPWAQASASVARTAGGTGLGLAISRQLADAMGGDLTLESEPGVGSTFSLSLVLDEAPAGALSVTAPGGAALAPLSGRALVVDDEQVNRLVSRELLRQLGLQVEVAASAEEALALSDTQRWDVVVTDLNLPGLGGRDLVAAFKGKAHPPRLVVLTADVTTEQRRACEAAGADAVLAKPARLAELRSALLPLSPVGRGSG